MTVLLPACFENTTAFDASSLPTDSSACLRAAFALSETRSAPAFRSNASMDAKGMPLLLRRTIDGTTRHSYLKR